MSKTITGISATKFFYDGVNPVQELNNTTPSANLMEGGIDEYFTRTDSTGTSNFLSDALGSTVALTDVNGTTQTQYSYDPYGGTSTSGAASTNSYEFTGREFDVAGLYYYRARYYSPITGRFISEDPLRFLASIPSIRDYSIKVPFNSADLYAYATNSPTEFQDPLGLWQMTITFGLGYGARFTFGNNGGTSGLLGLLNGQWNIGLYGGIGEGWSVDADLFDRGCHPRGTNWGVEGAGEIGAGPHLEGEAHVGTSSWGNLNFGFPGTPLGWTIGTEGATVPTLGVGESALIGIGGTHYF